MDSIGKQTIITILAGQQAPVEVLQLMLDNKPSQFGFTVQGKEGNDPDLSSERTDEIPTIEQLMQLNLNAKSFNLHLYFGFLPGKVDAKNIQPFLVTDGNDTPYMSLMVEGVFGKFSEPANMTEEMNLFDKFIYPEIETVLELTDGNMEKLVKHLHSDRFNDSFLSHTDHRGVLHILPLEGDPILLSKNELGETYPWGYMSQRHGYGDAKQDVVVKTVNTAKTGWWKKSAPAQKTSVPAVETKVEKTVEKTPEKKESRALRPPSFVHANSDIKAWYTAVHGQVPSNWKKRIPVTVSNSVPEWKDIKEFQAWVASQKVSSTPAKTDSAVLSKNSEKLSLPKNAAQAVAEGTGVLLGKTELEGALDYVSKYLDGQSEQTIDPKTIQGIEKKVPTLSETLAFDKTSYLNWPRAAVFKFFHEHPTAAALAFFEVRDLLRPHLKDEKTEVKTTAEGDKVVTKTTKTGDTTSVSSEVVDTKASKGSWWKKKAA